MTLSINKKNNHGHHTTKYEENYGADGCKHGFTEVLHLGVNMVGSQMPKHTS
jgi:hypothetical protein